MSAGKIILGELGGIETGVRQMLRVRPLETEQVDVRGKALTVPTLDETLRIKAWLCVQRNQTRDYLDVAALSDRIGVQPAGDVLSRIDEYNQRPETVATQLARQLADPHPRDEAVTRHLAEYKALDTRWHDWASVVAQSRAVAVAMLGVGDARGVDDGGR